MTEYLRNNNFPIVRYQLWKTALVTIDLKKEFRVHSSNNEGHWLYPADCLPEAKQFFQHVDFYLLHAAGRVDIDQFFYAEGRHKPKTTYEPKRVVDLRSNEMKRIVNYQAILDNWLRRKAAWTKGCGWPKVTLSIASLERELSRIKQELTPKPRQGGTVIESVTMPSPRHFRRLLNRYIDSAYDAMSLVKFTHKRTKKLNLAEAQDLQVWTEFAHNFADPKQPKVTHVHVDLVAHLDALNAERRAQGLREHQIPTYRQFLDLVNGLDLHWVKAGREGKEAAANYFRIAYGNHDVERPGEVVEFDEWTVDLITWFGWAKLLEHFTPEELNAIQRVRLKVVVGIDVATRCILAMRFTPAAATERTVIDAIEMMVTDKSRLAALAGATSLWPYHLLPEMCVADNGGAFAGFQVRGVMLALDIQYMHPPAGMPWLRGSIEAVFKTFGGQLLHWFEGRTFGSIFEKGDYQSHKRVSLSMDQLNLLLGQAVMDVYHHQVHSMTGETPHNRWMRLSEKYGVLPPPPRRVRRAVFGTRMEREITAHGITVLGIPYQSKEVQQYRLQAKSAALIRVDRFNLDAISMWTGEGWLTVPAAIPVPQDVSIWEWTGAAREIVLENAADSEINLSVMLGAVNRLRASGAAATARAGIATVPVDEATINKLTSYFNNKRFIDDLEGQAPELVPLLRAEDPLLVGIPGVDDELVLRAPRDNAAAATAPVVPQAPVRIKNTNDIQF